MLLTGGFSLTQEAIEPSESETAITSELSEDADSQSTIESDSEPVDEETGSPGDEDPEDKLSSIEKIFDQRMPDGERLNQFGYEFFSDPLQKYAAPVGEGYVVGPGDVLNVYLWGDPVDLGEIDSFFQETVGPDGTLFLPATGLYNVWGQTIGGIEALLTSAMKLKYNNFELKVTLARLRILQVYASGFVTKPGVVNLTAAHSILDALSLAGGVEKNGSLRRVVLKRWSPDGTVSIGIDLYDLLIRGDIVNIGIREKDSLFVEQIGSIVGVTGAVKRPAIYEVQAIETLDDILSLAGGMLPSARTDTLRILRFENGGLKIIEGDYGDEDFRRSTLKDGDLVQVAEVDYRVSNSVEIRGDVVFPGMHSVEGTPTLQQLLRKGGMLPETNNKYGELYRLEAGGRERYVSFSPESVLEGVDDITLQAGDIVSLLPRSSLMAPDFDRFPDTVVLRGALKYPGSFAFRHGTKLSDLVTPEDFLFDTDRTFGEILRRDIQTAKERAIRFRVSDVFQAEDSVELQRSDIVTFFPRFSAEVVAVAGEIRDPITISYFDEMRLLDALRTVEFSQNVGLLKAEVIRTERPALSFLMGGVGDDVPGDDDGASGEVVVPPFNAERVGVVLLEDLLHSGVNDSNIELRPGDRIVIRPIDIHESRNTVRLLGEIARPGIYSLEDSSRLADVLRAAGGYTERAFPSGLILIRESAKKLQEAQWEQMVSELGEVYDRANLESGGGTQQTQISRIQALLDQVMGLRQTVFGRIALEVAPTLTSLSGSAGDILLAPGDYIYIPARPSHVFIFGEVRSQTALAFVEGRNTLHYLEQVGGPTAFGDLANAYVIRSNGKVVTGGRFLGSNLIDGIVLEEGDAVFVPVRVNMPKPFGDVVLDISQVLSQIAATTLSTFAIINQITSGQ